MKSLVKRIFCTDKSWGLLLLRLFLGWIFIEAGLKKVFGVFGGPGIGGFAAMLEKIVIFYPRFFAPLTAWSELICGLLLVVGLFSRFTSAIVAIIMAVAIVKVHPTSFNYPGIVFAGSLVLLNLGSGAFSLDRFIAKK